MWSLVNTCFLSNSWMASHLDLESCRSFPLRPSLDLMWQFFLQRAFLFCSVLPKVPSPPLFFPYLCFCPDILITIAKKAEARFFMLLAFCLGASAWSEVWEHSVRQLALWMRVMNGGEVIFTVRSLALSFCAASYSSLWCEVSQVGNMPWTKKTVFYSLFRYAVTWQGLKANHPPA
jgi:hypothetical protein